MGWWTFRLCRPFVLNDVIVRLGYECLSQAAMIWPMGLRGSI